MKIVADTNAIVAAILKDGACRKIIFLSGTDIIVPEFVAEELEKHRKIFVAKSGLSEEDYLSSIRSIFSNVIQIPRHDYLSLKKEAIAISPDPDDWPFFAVALKEKHPIWTNEKRLKKQDAVLVYNTAELIRLLNIGGL